MAARRSAAKKPVSSLVPHLQELVHELTSDFTGVVRRQALSNDGWFVKDTLFALVSRDGRIVVKLPDAADQDALLAMPGANAWRIGGKAPMRAWIQLPEAMHDDRESLAGWLERAWRANAAAPRKKRR